jgi:hypothetical protein
MAEHRCRGNGLTARLLSWSRAMRARRLLASGAAATDPGRDLPPILANRPLVAGGDQRGDPDVDADRVTAFTGSWRGKLDPDDAGFCPTRAQPSTRRGVDCRRVRPAGSRVIQQ